MSERRLDEQARPAPEESGAAIAVPRNRWMRIATLFALGLLILFALAIAFAWMQRRPIAAHFLKREFERRNVDATTGARRTFDPGISGTVLTIGVGNGVVFAGGTFGSANAVERHGAAAID